MLRGCRPEGGKQPDSRVRATNPSQEAQQHLTARNQSGSIHQCSLSANGRRCTQSKRLVCRPRRLSLWSSLRSIIYFAAQSKPLPSSTQCAASVTARGASPAAAPGTPLRQRPPPPFLARPAHTRLTRCRGEAGLRVRSRERGGWAEGPAWGRAALGALDGALFQWQNRGRGPEEVSGPEGTGARGFRSESTWAPSPTPSSHEGPADRSTPPATGRAGGPQPRPPSRGVPGPLPTPETRALQPRTRGAQRPSHHQGFKVIS